MDFDAVRLEELKAEILEIEDFDDVSEALMSEINKNEELYRLFEEMKALSALVGDSTPEPSFGGVTLHDAVMHRIESGDTVPRYINKGMKYPVATVACLLVCFAVVLIARSGIAGNFAAKESFDSAAPETESVAENGTANYEFEFFALDEAADEEYVVIETETAKSKIVARSKNDTAELKAAPTEGAPELQSVERYSSELPTADAVTDDSGTVNAPVLDAKDQSSRVTVSGGAGAASGGAVMFSKAPADTEASEGEEDKKQAVYLPTFLHENESYTLSEVFEMYKNGTLFFNINADIYDEVWAALLEAFAMCVAEENVELSEFVSENYRKSLE